MVIKSGTTFQNPRGTPGFTEQTTERKPQPHRRGYIRMKDGSSVSIPRQRRETVLDKLTGKTAGYKNSIRISCARITRTNIDNGYTVA